MIQLRPLKDSKEIKEIYDKYYKDKFEFVDNFVCSFVVEDSEGIITGGGIRLVPEVIIYTDKSKGLFKIGRALVIAINACIGLVSRMGLSSFIAVTSDTHWKKQLIRRGFVEKGNNLSFRIE